MIEGGETGAHQARERLLPVVGGVFLTYLTLLILGYFIGNAIYQIP